MRSFAPVMSRRGISCRRFPPALTAPSACLALFAGALLAHPAAAQQVAANTRPGGRRSTGEIETVVVTGTAFNADVAPAKASLDTMEPQTIINQSYIQDSVANTADYTTILAIAPSMTGMDINGPGLSDGNVKNTLRGLPDGNFALLYDGIPFGDTNGPTHHSESYFPGATIGSIDVDRGPGNAGNLGAATYGGSVNMFSEVLSADQHATRRRHLWQLQHHRLQRQFPERRFRPRRHQHPRPGQFRGHQFRRLSDAAEHRAPEFAGQGADRIRAGLDRDRSSPITTACSSI